MNTDEQLKLVYNLTRFEMQYPQFCIDMVTTLLNDVMLAEIHARMKALHFSEKIINSTRIENINVYGDGTIQYKIISDYKSESGFDVSKAREEGTKRHFIKPVNGKALSWVAGYVRLFSKGHWVKGMRRSRIISKTRKEYEPKIQKMLDEATDNFYLKLIGEKV